MVKMELAVADLNSGSMSEISSFFKDASVFITGATGFLGHVLLSKLLRSCPDVKAIYVLLREKKGKTAMDRFNEMLEDEVFEILKTECPESILKVRPIVGDCLQPMLGLSPLDQDEIRNNVNVIFHVAATVRFDAPLKDAVPMNIRAIRDLLDLAHEMKQLKAFVHVSTAFSNCVDRRVVEEKLYDPPISADNLMLLVNKLDNETLERITPGLLGNYPNTYVFTKAVAEEVCNLKGAGLPLVIFRPAIVISTVKEPIPGWINNIYGPTGVVAAAAVGLMRVLHANKNTKANVVPCDFVVNAAIASAWSIGTKDENEATYAHVNGHLTNGHLTNRTVSKGTAQNGTISNETVLNNDNLVNGNILIKKLVNGTIPNGHVEKNSLPKHTETKTIPIYNYSCDLMEKPFTWNEFMLLNEKEEPLMPSNQLIWAYSLTLCKFKLLYNIYCFLFHLFPAFVADNLAKLFGKEPRLMGAYQKIHKLGSVLSYFSTKQWKMTNDNVQFLWSRLSQKDKEVFNFNLNSIDWDNYFHIHCVGIRKFILKEKPETIPAAMKRRRRILYAHYSLVYTMAFCSLYFCFRMAKQFFYN